MHDPIVHYDDGSGVAYCGRAGGLILRYERHTSCPACLDKLQPDRPRAPTRCAELADWKAALAAAHVSICLGRFGAHVLANESFAHALAREAAKFMNAEGLGRPRGEVPEDWLGAVEHFNKLASCAPDGMVATEHDLRTTIDALNMAALANVLRASKERGGPMLGRLRRMSLS